MRIQSCSIDVPPSYAGGGCINDCLFCVSKMHKEAYKNQMSDNMPFFDLYLADYIKRLEFVRDNGCNTLMLTGNIDPQQNRHFLTQFGIIMMLMKRPFRCIEMQTTGAGLNREYLRFLRNHVGVNTISLSLSDMFNDDTNARIIGGGHLRLPIDIRQLCADIKEYDFNLRLSLNLTSGYNTKSYEEVFRYAREELNADQITFRVLYSSNKGTPQDKWIEENSVSNEWLYGQVESSVFGYTETGGLIEYIKTNGKPLSILEYGQTQYDIHGMSTIVDDDCMSKKLTSDHKYLILRPNCKLYSQWDSPASLIF